MKAPQHCRLLVYSTNRQAQGARCQGHRSTVTYNQALIQAGMACRTVLTAFHHGLFSPAPSSRVFSSSLLYLFPFSARSDKLLSNSLHSSRRGSSRAIVRCFFSLPPPSPVPVLPELLLLLHNAGRASGVLLVACRADRLW